MLRAQLAIPKPSRTPPSGHVLYSSGGPRQANERRGVDQVERADIRLTGCPCGEVVTLPLAQVAAPSCEYSCFGARAEQIQEASSQTETMKRTRTPISHPTLLRMLFRTFSYGLAADASRED